MSSVTNSIELPKPTSVPSKGAGEASGLVGRVPRRFLCVEPFFAETGHEHFNIAFLRLIERACSARIQLACAASYRQTLARLDRDLVERCTWVSSDGWGYQEYRLSEFFRRLRWLQGIVRRAAGDGTEVTDLVVLGATGPILAALSLLSWSRMIRSRIHVVLHGNVNDVLHDWRPKNPLVRWISFDAQIRRLRGDRIRLIALETWIRDRLSARYPSAGACIRAVPHPIDEEESVDRRAGPPSESTLVVLFLGQATERKGFPTFIQFAQRVRESQVAANTAVSLRAAGVLSRDMRSADQSVLDRSATTVSVPRAELLMELKGAEFVFLWQSDYYELSASGSLIDCINHGVPLLGRLTPAIRSMQSAFGQIGLFAEDLDGLYALLVEYLDCKSRNARYIEWQHALQRARRSRESGVLIEWVNAAFSTDSPLESMRG